MCIRDRVSTQSTGKLKSSSLTKGNSDEGDTEVDRHSDEMTLPNRIGYSVHEQQTVNNNPHTREPSHPIEEAPYWDENEAKKNFVRSHRLFPVLFDFVNRYGETPPYDEGIVNQPRPHFPLDDFLASRGIDRESLDEEDPKTEEFVNQVEDLKDKYDEELQKLDRVCDEFCARLSGLLHEQSHLRPINDKEAHFKILGIQQKFEFVKSQLRQNVCNNIVALEKQFFHRKKRRALPKEASKILSQWFFEHLNDPYPSEEEKSYLAAAGGLTITQVNHWFGNKRIRYKRKCLEQEQKRGGLQDDMMGYPDSPPHQAMPAPTAVQPSPRMTRSKSRQ
eukprot:TRINITY_DN5642_c0_g1_i1.p1 TRINITY_DN5642_c0_g1~~TRINITY_DN5642_c0_g1_i1.p1  ORF type:complete len:334 (+),score=73.40 TRINITY_DN5642_c0_g1_i1:1-1002(+)